MKTIEAVKKILLEQIEGCRQLLSLLQRERVCLMELHQEEVETVTKEKDILVLKLKLLEEERKRLLDRLMESEEFRRTLKQEERQQMSLQRLAGLLGDSSLMEMRSKLISLSQSIKELNDLNKIMIDRTLSYLKKSNRFLGMLTPGMVPAGQKGALLSREL
jgi:flagellar biosynthesis/type III secretory pathway chaperone